MGKLKKKIDRPKGLHFEVLINGSWKDMTDDQILMYAYPARYNDYRSGISVIYNEGLKKYSEIFEEMGSSLEEVEEQNRLMLIRIDEIKKKRIHAQQPLPRKRESIIYDDDDNPTSYYETDV